VKHCVPVISGLHVHRSLMHLDNLLDDVEPEPKALILPRLAPGALERFEEVRHNARRNRAHVED
jgi:hypothetical protein